MWQKFKKILFCMFPHVETFRRQWNVNHIYRNENSKMTNGCMKWRNKRENLREKSFLSWQNIWNSRQITTDIKEKLGNKEEVFRGEGFSLVLFTFLYETNGNHATELSIVGHVISEWHWKSSFGFTEIVNNYGLKRGAVYQIVRVSFHFSLKL